VEYEDKSGWPGTAVIRMYWPPVAGGGVRIVARYLVYPDRRQVDLLAGAPRLFDCCARRTVGATRHRRAAQHRESALSLQ
jgi:hypothetical protein